MAVNVVVRLEELPEDKRVQRLDAKMQNTTMESLKDECLNVLANRLPRQQWEADCTDSRHFWQNDTFLPFQNRTIFHVATTPTISLSLWKDYYLVSTPFQARKRYAIDPELTVEEVLYLLHQAKKIGDICCYEALDAQGHRLETHKSLYQQDVFPYRDETKQELAHIRIRTRQNLLTKALAWLIVAALLGVLTGWLLHHFAFPPA
jgi:hypothetical protein